MTSGPPHSGVSQFAEKWVNCEKGLIPEPSIISPVGELFEIPRRALAALVCVGFMTMSFAVLIEVPGQASALSPHSPIVILGDSDFTAANGVTQGDGTAANPYVIEGWSFDTSAGPGIQVRDTTVFFVIRDVTLNGGAWGMALVVANAAHALVQGVTVSNAGCGVRIEACTGAVVRGITARYCIEGVLLFRSDSCTVMESNFQSNNVGVEIADSTNAMIYSNTFTDGGVSIVGDLWHDDTYNSHVIAPNNTVNGRPLLCYSFQDGVNIDSGGAGELIFLSCTKVKISGIAFDSQFAGMIFALCNQISIENCSFDGAGGPACLSCENVTVSNNVCTHGTMMGFYQCTNLIVKSNVIEDSYYMGIEIHNCWTVTASSNTIEGTDRGYGISCTSDDVTFNDNALTNCGFYANIRSGNDVRLPPNNTVNGKPVLFYQNQDDVVIDSVPAGQVLIGSCDRVWIGNISVTNTVTGITVEDCTDVTVFHTALEGNQVGLTVYDSRNCKVLYNRLEGNLYYGALIEYVTGGTVYGNTFKNNEEGLDLWSDNDVNVFRNIFIGNDLQASEAGCTGVVWDAGYPEGGNFWSDYSGTDKFSGPNQDIPGSDGFGDTPYSIGDGSVDKYPFMSPPDVTIPPPPPPAGINATIDIEPGTLNLKRMGKWITAYIDLPSGYDARDIVVESVVLNGRFPATGPFGIGDFDKDKELELMVKFDWAKSLRLDLNAAGTMTMTVSGLLSDGTAFQGSVEVTISSPGSSGSVQSYSVAMVGINGFVAALAAILMVLASAAFIRLRRSQARV